MQKVAIIGHSFSSRLGLIRSVAQMDCEIIVVVLVNSDEEIIKPEKPIDCYSKYVHRVLYCLRKDKEMFIRLLLNDLRDPAQKIILIPDSDDIVALIDENKERLSNYFYFPRILGERDSITEWMDKSRQKELARQVGLNVANARIVDITDGRYVIPSDVNYPCYTKPLATMNGGKGGMQRCGNEIELVSALEFFIRHRNRSGRILVEDYKVITKEYAVCGFSDGKNVVIPGVLQLLEISKVNKGIALQGRVMPINGFETIINSFKEMIVKIGFVGLFDIDFYESDGRLYFCELNLRIGGSGYAITKMGINLPAMYVNMCIGKDWSDAHIKEKNAIYVNERMCLADWNLGYMTNKEFYTIIKTADIRFIDDDDDIGPQKRFKKICKKRRLINSMKRILSK